MSPASLIGTSERAKHGSTRARDALRQAPAAALALALGTAPAAAQDVAVLLGGNPGPASFKPASELPPPGPEAFVIGGKPVKPSDFGATLVSLSDGGLCTASVVGPTAVLTAAHCVGHRQAIEVVVSGAARPVRGTCDHPTGDRGYAEDGSADYAMCLLQSRLELDRYETIGLDPSKVDKAARVKLTGYGCTAQGGGVDRVLRIGDADVTAVPGEVNIRFEAGGPVLPAPNYFKTRGRAALCPGDSGGATYDDEDADDRLIIGVNSRVVFATNESLLSATSTEFAVAFFKTWAKDNRASVCGIDKEAVRCR